MNEDELRSYADTKLGTKPECWIEDEPKSKPEQTGFGAFLAMGERMGWRPKARKLD